MRQKSPPYSWIQSKKGIVSFNHEAKVFGTLTKCDAVLELILPPGVSELLNGECHIAHDDQLKIISGSAIALILWNKQIHYVPLNETSDVFVIPALTWHCLVNIENVDTQYQNWMILHKQPTKKDYYPAPIKHKFDFSAGELALRSMSHQILNLKTSGD
jgi:hypothetical protein